MLFTFGLEHVPIELVRAVDVLMPKVPRDNLNGLAFAQPQRTAGVTQVMDQ